MTSTLSPRRGRLRPPARGGRTGLEADARGRRGRRPEGRRAARRPQGHLVTSPGFRGWRGAGPPPAGQRSTGAGAHARDATSSVACDRPARRRSRAAIALASARVLGRPRTRRPAAAGRTADARRPPPPRARSAKFMRCELRRRRSARSAPPVGVAGRRDGKRRGACPCLHEGRRQPVPVAHLARPPRAARSTTNSSGVFELAPEGLGDQNSALSKIALSDAADVAPRREEDVGAARDESAPADRRPRSAAPAAGTTNCAVAGCVGQVVEQRSPSSWPPPGGKAQAEDALGSAVVLVAGRTRTGSTPQPRCPSR